MQRLLVTLLLAVAVTALAAEDGAQTQQAGQSQLRYVVEQAYAPDGPYALR